MLALGFGLDNGPVVFLVALAIETLFTHLSTTNSISPEAQFILFCEGLRQTGWIQEPKGQKESTKMRKTLLGE